MALTLELGPLLARHQLLVLLRVGVRLRVRVGVRVRVEVR